MQIWPAIDLRDGRCVRLQQGDFARETVFGDDPAGMARRWVSQGATALHLVDLDGARSGQPANLPAVRAIVEAAGVDCQVGGGIRDEAAIRQLLDIGVTRVVIGTQAIKQPDWFARTCRTFPGRLVLGLDARDGRVATDGWLEVSEVLAVDLAARTAGLPLAAIVFTDITTDGMLGGPNLASLAAVQRAAHAPVIASGGVTTAEDVRRLAEAGVAGCIVGRALYEGTLTLADALAAAEAHSVAPP